MNIKKEIHKISDNPAEWSWQDNIEKHQEHIQKIIDKLRDCDLKKQLEQLLIKPQEITQHKKQEEITKKIKKIKEFAMSIDDKVLKHFTKPGFIAKGIVALAAIVTFGAATPKADACNMEYYFNKNTKQNVTLYNCNGQLYDLKMNRIAVTSPYTPANLTFTNNPEYKNMDKSSVQPFKPYTPEQQQSEYARLKNQAYAYERNGNYKAAIESILSISPNALEYSRQGKHEQEIQELLRIYDENNINKEEQAESLLSLSAKYSADKKNNVSIRYLQIIIKQFSHTNVAESARLSLKYMR